MKGMGVRKDFAAWTCVRTLRKTRAERNKLQKHFSCANSASVPNVPLLLRRYPSFRPPPLHVVPSWFFSIFFQSD